MANHLHPIDFHIVYGETLSTLNFHILRKQPQHISFWTSKTVTTLAFVPCKSNSTTLVSESFENDLIIGFHLLQKQLNYIGFRELKKWPQHWLSFIKKTTQLHWFSKTLKMILTLAFVHCKSNSISLVSHHIYDSSVFFSFLAFMISTKSLNQHHKFRIFYPSLISTHFYSFQHF
jgi:hypothetical protein